MVTPYHRHAKINIMERSLYGERFGLEDTACAFERSLKQLRYLYKINSLLNEVVLKLNWEDSL
ncbi:hypothetical protein GCM10008933_18130 [Paenibacillus motobuensis]|uniref:Uncharacterized protein n=1 Tax=Paenibacillus motobuensis TaxID=295324 RepID=A0ABN0Y900_9BACL